MALRDIEDRLAATKALELVLENDFAPFSKDGKAIALLPPNLDISRFFKTLECFSPYQNDIAAWSARGIQCSVSISGLYDTAIIFPSNSRDETLWLFSKAFEALNPGGLAIATMPKDFGAARFEKEFSRVFADTQCESKYHCRVFWGKKSSSTPPPEWNDAGQNHPIPGTRLISSAASFSADGIDEGSALLVDALPNDLTGKGADLGAGYGYIAHAIIEKCLGITGIDLYEIDHRALECAKINLVSKRPSVETHYLWKDVRSGIPAQSYDWIVMNPPFHDRGFESASLGIAFLKVAAAGLKPNGKLYFVANRQLPYEAELQRSFESFRELKSVKVFKVVEATV